MIDIHTHLLPQMDDGSKSLMESLAMLRALADQGVSRVAATPHFYPGETSREEFLARRGAAAARLEEGLTPELPRIMLGAEVYYFEGIARAEAAEELRIQGTELLLVEMPFRAWTARMVDEVLDLNARRGMRVLLAHIERYLRFQKPEVWDVLEEAGVLFQSNASFFLDWKTRRKALRMLKAGRIHLLGSDCHNMTTRPPRLGEALAAVGPEGRRMLEDNLEYFAV